MNRWIFILFFVGGVLWGEHADRSHASHSDLPFWQEANHARQENNEYLFPVDVKQANEFQIALYQFLGTLEEINYGMSRTQPTN